MKLADRSPGTLIVLAAVVVYSQILIEIGMYMVSSTAAVVFAMVTAIGAALGIMKWFYGLVSDGDQPAETQVAATAPAPRRRTPRARPIHA